MTSNNNTGEIPGRGIAHAAREQYEQRELEFPKDLTRAEQFEKFHEGNPRVYETLVRLARDWVVRTGRDRLGIKALYERARWEIAIATQDPDFKINNNYTSYYARLIMLQEPDLRGLFQLRHSDGANLWAALHKHGIAA